MTHFNPQDFIDEIKYTIKAGDQIKAKAALSYLDKVDKKTQQLALLALSQSDHEFAIPVISGILASNPYVALKFPTLKETLLTMVMDTPDVLLKILSDSEIIGDKKFSLAIAQKMHDKAFLVEIVGEIRLDNAVPILLSTLREEKDEKIIKAIVIALGKIGDPSTISALTEFLYAGNNDLIVAAIHAMGEIATPTAIQKLHEKMGADPELDLLILDVFAQVQIPEALIKLNESLISHYAHIRTTGKKKLIEIGNKVVPLLIHNLDQSDIDLQIHTLNVLGDIGDNSAVPSIRKLLHNEPKDPNVRFAAYETLGSLSSKQGAFALAAGLQDPVENVRSAAAVAIDKNFNEILSAGIKNLINEHDESPTNIIVTIIDSKCDRIFLSLTENDFFIKFAAKYLSEKAHPDIKRHFSKLFTDNGYDNFAEMIQKESKQEAKQKLKVFAVDDSKMILNIYRSMLHNLEYESQLFEFPAEALDKISSEKPDLVLTDLNMPDIDGIELTKGIRKYYNKDQLPIIMVTTQNDSHDNEVAISAGVNDILHKPFTEKQIGEVLKKFI